MTAIWETPEQYRNDQLVRAEPAVTGRSSVGNVSNHYMKSDNRTFVQHVYNAPVYVNRDSLGAGTSVFGNLILGWAAGIALLAGLVFVVSLFL